MDCICKVIIKSEYGHMHCTAGHEGAVVFDKKYFSYCTLLVKALLHCALVKVFEDLCPNVNIETTCFFPYIIRLCHLL